MRMVKELLRARLISGRVMSSRHKHEMLLRNECHAPRRRGIQYAAAYRFYHCYLGVLDRPVKPGDDSE
ncbi:hypothetical protein ACVWY3_004269 [Bradyrhizobium sp. USDA 4486]